MSQYRTCDRTPLDNKSMTNDHSRAVVITSKYVVRASPREKRNTLRPPGVHPLPVGAARVHPAPGCVPPVCTPLPVSAPHVHPPSWSCPPCLHPSPGRCPPCAPSLLVTSPRLHPPSWSRPTRLHPPFARGAHTRRWPRGSVAASPTLHSRVNGSRGGGLGRADPVCWARGQREGCHESTSQTPPMVGPTWSRAVSY